MCSFGESVLKPPETLCAAVLRRAFQGQVFFLYNEERIDRAPRVMSLYRLYVTVSRVRDRLI